MSLLFCLHKTVVAESWEASTRFSGSAFSSEVQARDVSSPEPPSRSAAEAALEFTSQASWGKAHSSSSEVSRPLSNRPERTTNNVCLALSSLISCQHLATRSVRSKDMGRSGDTTGSVLWATWARSDLLLLCRPPSLPWAPQELLAAILTLQTLTLPHPHWASASLAPRIPGCETLSGSPPAAAAFLDREPGVLS